jgi:hypothetical protein
MVSYRLLIAVILVIFLFRSYGICEGQSDMGSYFIGASVFTAGCHCHQSSPSIRAWYKSPSCGLSLTRPYEHNWFNFGTSKMQVRVQVKNKTAVYMERSLHAEVNILMSGHEMYLLLWNSKDCYIIFTRSCKSILYRTI